MYCLRWLCPSRPPPIQLTNLRTNWVGFTDGSDGKESAWNVGDLSLIPGSGRSPREGNGYSSILAWRIPQTEEPGGLQSVDLQRVRHDWATNTFTFGSGLKIIHFRPLDYIAHQVPPSMGFSRQEYWSGFIISFSKGSSQPRDWTQISRIVGRRFNL